MKAQNKPVDDFRSGKHKELGFKWIYDTMKPTIYDDIVKKYLPSMDVNIGWHL